METPRFKQRRGLKAKPRRARRSTESVDDESSSESANRSRDGLRRGSPDGLRPGSSDGLRPGEARIKKQRGSPWGTGGWQLAEIANAIGEIIGYGATCGGPVDSAGGTVTCTKQVTIGNGKLRPQDLILRLKRWLTARIEYANWDEAGAAACM